VTAPTADANQAAPRARVAALRPQRDPDQPPLCSTVVARQNAPRTVSAPTGLSVTRLDREPIPAKFALPCSRRESDAGRFRPASIARLAGDFALVAFTEGGEVGSDLAAARHEPGQDVLAAALAPSERIAYFARPAGERPAAFFAAWVRHEAYVKALGVDLARPVAAIADTSSADRDRAIGAPGEPSAALWRSRDLAPAADDVAALATSARAGPGWRIGRCRWPVAGAEWARR
jgi:hypothetical protein